MDLPEPIVTLPDLLLSFVFHLHTVLIKSAVGNKQLKYSKLPRRDTVMNVLSVLLLTFQVK